MSPGPRSALALLCCCLLSAIQAAAGLRSSEEPPLRKLTPEEQAALAEQFAPVLVFHGSEEYFPVSPLFALFAPFASFAIGGPDQEAMDARVLDGESPVSLLGTPESRRERYRALTLVEKSGIATVYYRAYPARRDSEEVVVLEYWLYYVQNDYRVRGSILPLWVDGSHPNDLEHIHLVLAPARDSGFALREVHASSHEGSLPANRYRYWGDEFRDGGHFLVELGSHALGPDIDEDGVFTPGDDGDSGYKVLWGIRDRGVTGMRYARSYMDARTEANSIVFEYAGVDPPTDGRLSYGLAPVDALRGEFARLELTDETRRVVFETERHWLKRVFGADNGSSRKLLTPPEIDPRGKSIGIDGFSHTERGFLVGGTLNLDEPGALLGARYSFLHGNRYVPDLVLEANGVLTTKQRWYASAQLLLSYPIDSSTKLMGGRALVTDSIRLERRQWDWIAAVEVRLGRMRIYTASRSYGPITRLAKEFRVSYFF